MQSVLGIFSLLLPAMVLASLIAPLSNSSNRWDTLLGADTTNSPGPLLPRQVDPKASGSSCADEGAWFCMPDNFQRCASGEWSIVQQCAPGTRCEPLGLTHNASQPAFGIYDGSSVTVMTVVSTTAFGIQPVTRTTTIEVIASGSQSTSTSVVPVTRTTTIDVIASGSQSTSSSVVTSSAVSSSIKTGTSTADLASSTAYPGTPKADASDGTRIGGLGRSTMGMISLCLVALFCCR